SPPISRCGPSPDQRCADGHQLVREDAGAGSALTSTRCAEPAAPPNGQDSRSPVNPVAGAGREDGVSAGDAVPPKRSRLLRLATAAAKPGTWPGTAGASELLTGLGISRPS